MPSKLFKLISLLLCFLLVFQQSGFAQVAGELNIAGHFAQFRHSLPSEKFRPLHLRSLSYDIVTDNFKVLLDKGNSADEQKFSQETKALFDYFLIGISLPDVSFWVNLRPDSPETIVDDYVAQTDVGRILLEADLQLKKDTAGYTSPQTPEGKIYWEKLYSKAGELLGSDNTTIPTLVRPWIVPGEIIIRETDDNAYIYKATLKVMLEEDYLKTSNARIVSNGQYSFKDPRLKALNEYSAQLLRELIIPKLTKEINTAKRYAPLRQVYYSLILAQWFKQRFLGKEGAYSRLIDRKDLSGLTSQENWSKLSFFQAYQKSFKEGEYNLSESLGYTVRSYFSGGIVLLERFPALPLKQGGTTSSPLGTNTYIQRIRGRASSSLTSNRDTLLADITRQGIKITTRPAAIVPVVSSPAQAASGMHRRDFLTMLAGVTIVHKEQDTQKLTLQKLIPRQPEALRDIIINDKETEERRRQAMAALEKILLMDHVGDLYQRHAALMIDLVARDNPTFIQRSTADALWALLRKEGLGPFVYSSSGNAVKTINRNRPDVISNAEFARLAHLIPVDAPLRLPAPHPAVVRELMQLIKEKGKITFSEYMRICLYDEKGGYYTSGTARINPRMKSETRGRIIERGDFSTYPDTLSPAFGEAMALQLHQMWEIMNKPPRFTVVEMGAGTGVLARDILAAARQLDPGFYRALTYAIVDISGALNEIQREVLKEFTNKVTVRKGSAVNLNPEDFPGFRGAFISNELPDAFPVERIKVSRRDGPLEKSYVTVDATGRFVEEWHRIDEGDPALEYIGKICKTEGISDIRHMLGNRESFIFPVNLDAERWYTNIAQILRQGQGYFLTIDYGVTQFAKYRDNEEHASRAYHSHEKGRSKEAVLAYPGGVDITSSTNFNFLRAIGEQQGLRTEGLIQQYTFLKNLIDRGSGDSEFHVLVQGGNVPRIPLLGISGRSIGNLSIFQRSAAIVPVASSPALSVTTPSFIKINTTSGRRMEAVNIPLSQSALDLIKNNTEYRQTASDATYNQGIVEDFMSDVFPAGLNESAPENLQKMRTLLGFIVSKRYELFPYRSPNRAGYEALERIHKKIANGIPVDPGYRTRLIREIKSILEDFDPDTRRSVFALALNEAVINFEHAVKYSYTTERILNLVVPFTAVISVNNPYPVSFDTANRTLELDLFTFLGDSSSRILEAEIRRITVGMAVSDILSRSRYAIPGDLATDIVLILLNDADINGRFSTGNKNIIGDFSQAKYIRELRYQGSNSYATLLRRLSGKNMTLNEKIDFIYEYLKRNFNLLDRYQIAPSEIPSPEALTRFAADISGELQNMRYYMPKQDRSPGTGRRTEPIPPPVNAAPPAPRPQQVPRAEILAMARPDPARAEPPLVQHTARTVIPRENEQLSRRGFLQKSAVLAGVAAALTYFGIRLRNAFNPSPVSPKPVPAAVSLGNNIYQDAPAVEKTYQRIEGIVKPVQPKFTGLGALGHRPASGMGGYGGTLAVEEGPFFTISSGNETHEMFISGIADRLGKGGVFEGGRIAIKPQGYPTEETVQISVRISSMNKGGEIRLPNILNGEILPGFFVDRTLFLDADGFITAQQDTVPTEITYTIRKWSSNGRFDVSQPAAGEEWLQEEIKHLPQALKDVLSQARSFSEKDRLNTVAKMINTYFAYSDTKKVTLQEGTWSEFLGRVLERDGQFVSDCDVLSMFAFIFSRALGLKTVFVLGFTNESGGRFLYRDDAHGKLIVEIDGKWLPFETTAVAGINRVPAKPAAPAEPQAKEQPVQPVPRPAPAPLQTPQAPSLVPEKPLTPLLPSNHRVENSRVDLNKPLVPIARPVPAQEGGRMIIPRPGEKIIEQRDFWMGMRKVRPGDVLTRIAEDYYDNGTQGVAELLARHNRISDPGKIRIGQTIRLPAELKHVIGPEDTPGKISKQYTFTARGWRQVQALNPGLYFPYSWRDMNRKIWSEGTEVVVARRRSASSPAVPQTARRDFLKGLLGLAGAAAAGLATEEPVLAADKEQKAMWQFIRSNLPEDLKKQVLLYDIAKKKFDDAREKKARKEIVYSIDRQRVATGGPLWKNLNKNYTYAKTDWGGTSIYVVPIKGLYRAAGNMLVRDSAYNVIPSRNILYVDSEMLRNSPQATYSQINYSTRTINNREKILNYILPIGGIAAIFSIPLFILSRELEVRAHFKLLQIKNYLESLIDGKEKFEEKITDIALFPDPETLFTIITTAGYKILIDKRGMHNITSAFKKEPYYEDALKPGYKAADAVEDAIAPVHNQVRQELDRRKDRLILRLAQNILKDGASLETFLSIRGQLETLLTSGKFKYSQPYYGVNLLDTLTVALIPMLSRGDAIKDLEDFLIRVRFDRSQIVLEDAPAAVLRYLADTAKDAVYPSPVQLFLGLSEGYYSFGRVLSGLDSIAQISSNDASQIYQCLKDSLSAYKQHTSAGIRENEFTPLVPYLINAFSGAWAESKMSRAVAEEITRRLINLLASTSSGTSSQDQVNVLLQMLHSESAASVTAKEAKADLFIRILMNTPSSVNAFKTQSQIVSSFDSPRAIMVNILNAARLPESRKGTSLAELFRYPEILKIPVELDEQQKRQLDSLQVPGLAQLIEEIVLYRTPPDLFSHFDSAQVCRQMVSIILHCAGHNPEMRYFLWEVLANSRYLDYHIDIIGAQFDDLTGFMLTGIADKNLLPQTRDSLIDLFIAFAEKRQNSRDNLVKILSDERVDNDSKIHLLSQLKGFPPEILAAVAQNSSLSAEFFSFLKNNPAAFNNHLDQLLSVFNPALLPYAGRTRNTLYSFGPFVSFPFLVEPFLTGSLNEALIKAEGDLLKAIFAVPEITASLKSFLTANSGILNKDNLGQIIAAFNPDLSESIEYVSGMLDYFKNSGFFIGPIIEGNLNNIIKESRGDIIKFTKMVFSSSPVDVGFKIAFIESLQLYSPVNAEKTLTVLLSALQLTRGNDSDTKRLREKINNGLQALSYGEFRDLAFSRLSQAINEDGFDDQGYTIIAGLLVSLVNTDKEKAKFSTLFVQKHSLLRQFATLASDSRRGIIPSDREFSELVFALANKSEALARFSAEELRNLNVLMMDRYQRWPKGGLSYIKSVIDFLARNNISLSRDELNRLTRYNQQMSHFSEFIYNRFRDCPIQTEEKFLQNIKSSAQGILEGRPYEEVKNTLLSYHPDIDDQFIFDLLMNISPKFRAGVVDQVLQDNLRHGVVQEKLWRRHIDNFIATISLEKAKTYRQVSLTNNRLVITHRLPIIQKGLAEGRRLDHANSQELIRLLSAEAAAVEAQKGKTLPRLLRPMNGESVDDYVQRIKADYCGWLGESSYVKERIKQISEAYNTKQDIVAMGLLATLLADGFKEVLRDAVNAANDSDDAKFKKEFNRDFTTLLDALSILLGVPQDKTQSKNGDIANEFITAKRKLIGKASRGQARAFSGISGDSLKEATANVTATFANMLTRFALARSREDSEQRWRAIIAQIKESDEEAVSILEEIIDSGEIKSPLLEKPVIDELNTPNEKIAEAIQALRGNELRDYIQSHALAASVEKARARWERILAGIAEMNPAFVWAAQAYIAELDLPVLQNRQDEIFGRLHNLVFADVLHEVSENQKIIIDRVVGTETLELEVAKSAWQAVYGATADICIYQDMNMLDRENFLLLAMKAEGQFVGYVNMHTVDKKDGKKLLLLAGINPSDQYLSNHSAREILGAIIDSAKILADISGKDALAISTASYAVSNRPNISALIGQYNFDKDKLGFDYGVGGQYTSNEYSIAWERSPAPLSQETTDSIRNVLPAGLNEMIDVDELYRGDRRAVSDIKNHLAGNGANIDYLIKVFRQVDSLVGNEKAKKITAAMATVLFKYGSPLSRVRIDLTEDGFGRLDIIHPGGMDIEPIKQAGNEILLLSAASPVSRESTDSLIDPARMNRRDFFRRVIPAATGLIAAITAEGLLPELLGAVNIDLERQLINDFEGRLTNNLRVLISRLSGALGVPPEFFKALLLSESDGNWDARSTIGAKNWMQLMARTTAIIQEDINRNKLYKEGKIRINAEDAHYYKVMDRILNLIGRGPYYPHRVQEHHLAFAAIYLAKIRGRLIFSEVRRGINTPYQLITGRPKPSESPSFLTRYLNTSMILWYCQGDKTTKERIERFGPGWIKRENMVSGALQEFRRTWRRYNLYCELTGRPASSPAIELSKPYTGPTQEGVYVMPGFYEVRPLNAALGTNGALRCAILVVVDRNNNQHYMGHINEGIPEESIRESLAGFDLQGSEFYVMKGREDSGSVDLISRALNNMGVERITPVQYAGPLVPTGPVWSSMNTSEGYGITTLDGKLYLGVERGYFPEAAENYYPVVTRASQESSDQEENGAEPDVSSPIEEPLFRLGGTFNVGGNVCKLDKLTDREEIRKTVGAWINSNQDSFGNYWLGRINQFPEGFLVTLSSDSGQMLGIMFMHRTTFPVYSDRYETVYAIDMIEIAQDQRGKGLGTILVAKAAEESLGDARIAQRLRGALLTEPARDEDYAPEGRRARDFYKNLGFSEITGLNPDVLSEEDRSDLPSFMFLSRNEAQKVLTEAKKLETGQLSLLPVEPPNESQDASSPAAEKGGIDFSALPIATQPALSASPLAINPGVLRNVNLDASWSQIQNMIQSGIVPSGERIKEYVEACCSQENMRQEIDKVLSCIADILRLEEEICQPTEPSLRELLVLLESDKQPQDMQAAIIKLAL